MDKPQQIKQLMELKALYEQGILTKEELESEKEKILGSQKRPLQQDKIDVPKEKEQVRPQEKPAKEEIVPASKTPEENKSSFKKYYGYIIGSIILILVIIGLVIFSTNSTQSQGGKSASYNKEIESTEPIALKGLINKEIGFSMRLKFNGNKIEGTEHYDSQKSDLLISIRGSLDNDGKMTLLEYDNNRECGKFQGRLDGLTYSGTFTNKKGKSMPFSANVMDEAELDKLEDEARTIEIINTEYQKDKYGINVEISADYPLTANNLLLTNTRTYICEVIATMFQVDLDGIDISDHQAAIKLLGTRKYDDLKKEKQNDEVPENVGYAETIEVKKSFENDNCVSFCGSSFYCHGGVGNSFRVGATFRKIDGKIVSIIKNPKDNNFKRVLQNAINSKLADGEEYIPDYIEDNYPMPREMPHLASNGVQFDYQTYEIGPGAMGQVSIIVPYESIKPYMTKEALSLIE